jgi:hypothetical protein
MVNAAAAKTAMIDTTGFKRAPGLFLRNTRLTQEKNLSGEQEFLIPGRFLSLST